jgi:hypothetical protein
MTGLDLAGSLALADATTLTLATGVITVTQVKHILAAESGTTDDLVTINVDASIGAGYEGVLILQADAGDTITLKDGTGNITTGNNADLVLTGDARVVLCDKGGTWYPLTNIAQVSAFTITNWTEDFALDCDAAAADEICDLLGTLIKALIASGVIAGTVSA